MATLSTSVGTLWRIMHCRVIVCLPPCLMSVILWSQGIVVAMPIYYSTGSRMKAFVWAFLSGVSEPIGGVFGWIILSNMGLLTYAIMFSLVAGMMIYISMSELIPSALAFDPQNKYVTKSIIIGMGIMAASLLMFTL